MSACSYSPAETYSTIESIFLLESRVTAELVEYKLLLSSSDESTQLISLFNEVKASSLTGETNALFTAGTIGPILVAGATALVLTQSAFNSKMQ